MLDDLGWLDDDAMENVLAERPAIEQKSHAARTPLLRTQEVAAREAPDRHRNADLLQRFPLARFPRRLAVCFHLPPRDRPALLVVRLENEQAARWVKDECARRRRDAGKLVWRVGRALIGHLVMIACLILACLTLARPALSRGTG